MKDTSLSRDLAKAKDKSMNNSTDLPAQDSKKSVSTTECLCFPFCNSSKGYVTGRGFNNPEAIVLQDFGGFRMLPEWHH